MTAAGLSCIDPLHITQHGARITRTDVAIQESPVALLYNGDAFAVMMATPIDLDDYALGFSLSEGIVADPTEFRLVDRTQSDAGIALHCAIPQNRYDALGERRRNVEGRSGCGLCGAQSLQAVLRPLPDLSASTFAVCKWQIDQALQALAQRQPLNAASGGAHAAAFVPYDTSQAMLVREDVGRHNALDKAIGAALREGLDLRKGYGLVTSRASYELVQKAATVGIGLLAAISAPTDLAIRTAERAGMTLIAFARGHDINVYANVQRIID